MPRLWITIGSAVTVAVLGFSSFSVASLLAHEEVTEESTFDAAGLRVLDLDTENGNVEIIGGDVDEVRVVADVSHGLRRTKHEAAIEGDTLVVRSDCPFGVPVWCRVDYRIVVPADMSVQARHANGSLIVQDVDGDVVAENHNGGVEVAGLGGAVHVSSDNGAVEATGLRADTVTATTENGSVLVTFAEPPTTVEARSRNGAVDVVLPDDATEYRVHVDTTHGSTEAAVRSDPSSDRSVVATTTHGAVSVRYPTG